MPFWDVQEVARTASTNADVAAAARAGAAEGLVVVAAEQTAGRGRLGRSWVAPPGTGLTLSALLRPAGVPATRWGWLPLLAGVALAEAVEEVSGLDTALKWPNDLLVAQRKLAGVLTERVDTPTGPAAVVGIGLNVSSRAEDLPVPTATSLRLAGVPHVDRAALLAAVLRRLAARYEPWRATGGDAERGGLRPAYVLRCGTLGRRVRVHLPGGEDITGLADGIDDQGRLLVDGRAMAAGDVVHVR
jgi:BirA family transcriptional regulator, biotin operon repressor / biotin---[acetyl-CoA-carboxylase] ligase